MSGFTHPETYPVRHQPTITRHDLGAHAACACGWSSAAPSPHQASKAYAAHVRATTQREGAQS